MRIAVRRWAAWAPGLATPADWQAWASDPWCPAGEESPALSDMPAMQRRRLNRLGRAALQAAWDCQGDECGMPVVFASRYGDATRSLALLEDLCAGDDVSPTGFGMSVHNAIGALYAIVRGDRANAVCVAAGQASAAAGWIEAAGLLATEAEDVLLVCYDDTLPEAWAAFRDEPPCAWSWAWRLAAARPGEPSLALRVDAGNGDDAATATAPRLPAGLDVMRFFLSGDETLSQPVEGRRWTWSRGIPA